MFGYLFKFKDGIAMELFHVVLNVVALAVNVCLMYFACRLLSVFRGGVMGRPWLFVCLGVLALAIGSSIFSFKYILDVGRFEVHAAGGLIMLLGGVLALIGIYLEYKNWTVPK
jgi:heme A synthase